LSFKTPFLSEENQHKIQAITKAAFEELFRDNFKGLCFFAHKYVRDIQTSKELVQDAFINLWEKREGIDTSKSVKSYLTTIVYNKCLNYIRDNKKFDREILEFENLFPVQDNASDEKLITSEISKQIKDAIDELPEKCREVFMLSRYQNLKYQEIADKLMISIKTVETQMSKALQHLRIKLADYLPIMLIIVEIIKNSNKN